MNKKIPDCFGDINRVFPKDDDGIRKVPDKCMESCIEKKECIIAAIESDKENRTESEIIDNAYDAGNINFLSRWSKKKAIAGKSAKHKEKKSLLNKLGILKRRGE